MLLNVAGGYLGQYAIVSVDGATLSQAITYCDQVIDSPTGNYTRARNLALKINNGELVPAGWMPLGTQEISYRTHLGIGGDLDFRVLQTGGPTLRFTFDLPHPSQVLMQLYALNGRKVVDLVSGSFAIGMHTVAWDGREASGAPLASGVYFARLAAGREARTVTVVLLK